MVDRKGCGRLHWGGGWIHEVSGKVVGTKRWKGSDVSVG